VSARYAAEAERLEGVVVALEVRRLEMIRDGFYRPVIDGIENEIANTRRTAAGLRAASLIGGAS
jgi:hypothetical protein